MTDGDVSFPRRWYEPRPGGGESPSIITIKARRSSAGGASTFQVIQDVVENHATV